MNVDAMPTVIQYQYWFYSIVKLLQIFRFFLLHCLSYLLNSALSILMFSSMWCRFKSSRINWITPFSSHNKNGVGMHSGTNQRIHLGHVATQPAVRYKRHKITSRSCGLYYDLRNTYNNQQVAAVNINTHCTILYDCRGIEKIHC